MSTPPCITDRWPHWHPPLSVQDMEAARGMLNLSMGPLELPVTQKTGSPGPPLHHYRSWTLELSWPKLSTSPAIEPCPPPLRRQDVVDTWNVVLRSMQTPKKTDTLVEVSDPQNKDPLYLNRDASRDKALQTMQERHRIESCSSSAESRSSGGKCHQSGSRSVDETGPKRGQQMPMEDQNSLGPVARIARPTLDWSQDILEPPKLAWKLPAGDGPAMPRQTLKFVVKMLEKLALAESATCAKVKPWIKPVPAELTSCGRGRGWAIAEKLQELAGMGPVATSHYTSKEGSPGKKQSTKKPTFPTPEEQQECRQCEEHKK